MARAARGARCGRAGGAIRHVGSRPGTACMELRAMADGSGRLKTPCGPARARPRPRHRTNFLLPACPQRAIGLEVTHTTRSSLRPGRHWAGRGGAGLGWAGRSEQAGQAARDAEVRRTVPARDCAAGSGRAHQRDARPARAGAVPRRRVRRRPDRAARRCRPPGRTARSARPRRSGSAIAVTLVSVFAGSYWPAVIYLVLMCAISAVCVLLASENSKLELSDTAAITGTSRRTASH